LEKAERQKIEQHRRRWETASAAVRHYDVRRILSGIRKELDARISSMAAIARTRLLEKRIRLQRLAGQLDALSPLAVLDRGYALIFDSAGKLVKDSNHVSAGDDVLAQVAKGSFTATVKNRSDS
jgi:exodeoxyribonuclease VII large subunit